MRVRDLAVLVRQDGRAGAVQHGGVPCAERRRLGRLDADKPDVRIVEEAGEDADGVRAAADTGDDDLRQPAFGVAGTALRASWPITACSSRTISGYGAGPTHEPIR